MAISSARWAAIQGERRLARCAALSIRRFVHERTPLGRLVAAGWTLAGVSATQDVYLGRRAANAGNVPALEAWVNADRLEPTRDPTPIDGP